MKAQYFKKQVRRKSSSELFFPAFTQRLRSGGAMPGEGSMVTGSLLRGMTLTLIFFLTILASKQVNAQGYCIPQIEANSTTNSVGIQNFTMGGINNTTVNPVYTSTYSDFSNLFACVTQGGSINWSITPGTGQAHKFSIYVDWNNDFAFDLTGTEAVYTIATTPATTVFSGSITPPAGQAPGSYRLRIVGDVANALAQPCLIRTSGEAEDYTLMVVSATKDMAAFSLPQPTTFSASNNNLTIRAINSGSVGVTSATIGYRIGNGPSVTQSATFSSVSGCQTVDLNFNTPLSVPPGMSVLKYWISNPNGSSDANAANDTGRITICTPLNGVYTINASGSGTNNFLSFTDAVIALRTCGVSGPVVFSVDSNTFTEQVKLYAIPGASATNTVSFIGTNRSKTVITFASQGNTNRHTLAFEACSFVRFKNMTIRSTGSTYGWVVHFTGSSVVNNDIQLVNCNIECAGTGATTTSTNFMGVLFGGSATNYASTIFASNIRIDSCNINGGYTNVYFSGNSAGSSNLGNYFTSNTMTNAYQYCMYSNYLYEIKFINNVISPRFSGTITAGSAGFYAINANSVNPGRHEITGNTITDCGNYGIFLSSVAGTVGFRGLIANNSVGGGFNTTATASYGMYFSSVNWLNIYNNSVNIDNSPSTESAAFYFIGNNNNYNLDVRNNQLQVTGTGPNSWPLWSQYSTSFYDLDYNNYYKASTLNSNLIYLGVNLNSSNMLGAFNYNTNSYNVYTPYQSPKVLKYVNGCIRGQAITAVPRDIEGNTRSSSPNVGSYEFANSVSNDIGILRFTSPVSPITIGSTNVGVILKNFGNNTVTSAIISYTINGANIKTVNWSGTLPPCGEIEVKFTGANQASIGGGLNLIQAFTSLPNGAADAVAYNDVAELRACPAMSGTFTIDAAGTGANNFKSFTSAVEALQCSGLGGPVVINVAKGTYIEQVTLAGIPGLSATNTLTFDGGAGNAASCILSFNNAQNASRHTWMIDNLSFINIRNLSILNTNTTYGWGVHLMGTVSNVNIDGCIIEVNGSIASTNFMAVVFTNSTTSYSNGTAVSKVTLNNNIIRGGYTSLMFYGLGSTTNSDIVITNNKMYGAYQYGVFLQSISGFKFRNNLLTMRTSLASSISLYVGSCAAVAPAFAEINNNTFTDAGQQAIYLTSSSNTIGARGKIINNMVAGGFRNTSVQAISLNSSNFWDVWYNSVNVDNAPTTANSSAYYQSSSTTVDVRNNHFVLSNPLATSATIYPAYVTPASATNTFDYNNLYRIGVPASIAFLNGQARSAVVGSPVHYKAVTGFSNLTTANCVSQDPNYVSRYDLHAANGCMTGVTIAGVTQDFDGDIRNNPPSIGADEGYSLDLGMLNIIAPIATSISGSQDVVFTVKNYGKTTITSFTAGYRINGGASTTNAWTGVLLPCDSVQITFSGAQAAAIPSAGYIVLHTFIANPNGSADNQTKNDTTARVYCNDSLAGNYTINPASNALNNYLNFNSLVANLNACGVKGNINVAVAAATFNEQVTIASTIPGLSGKSIFFQGVDSINTRLTFNSGHTLKLDGADRISFKNIGFENTGSASAYAVWLANKADSNSFSNCRFSTVSATASTVFPVVLMASTYQTSGNSSFNTFENSVISGGFAGISIYGTSAAIKEQGNKILNNVITGAYQYGVFVYFQNGFDMIGNTVSGALYGTFLNTVDNMKAQRNVTKEITGQYGMYFSTINAGNGTPVVARSIIENNMVYNMTSTGTTQGIYLTTCYNTDVFHNSVYIPSTSASSRAADISGGTGISVKNNIFANASSTGYAFYNTSQAIFSSFDYNLFYSPGNFFVRVNNTDISDMTNLKALNINHNQNSRSGVPNFINPLTDLHLNQNLEAMYGDVTVSTTVDYDQDIRCLIAKTVGADESTFAPPLSVQFSLPDTAYINSTFSVINAALPGDLKRHQWDFNNDGSIEATSINTSYSFATPGTKQVKLITSTCNGSVSLVKTIVIVAPSVVPVADFITDKYEVAPFEAFNLKDLSTNGATAWEWEILPVTSLGFYDPFLKNPEVILATPGKYTVCLTSENSVGKSVKTCKVDYILVKDVFDMCVGDNFSQSASGEIYDSGGKNFGYNSGENCTFLIAPCASSVNIRFSSFAIANPGHFMRIYDGSDATGVLLGTYSSTSGLPGGTNGLTAKSGNMFITWSSVGAGAAAGWSAAWTSVPKNNSAVSIGFQVVDSAYENTLVNFTNTSGGESLIYDWDLDGDAFSDATTRDASFTYFLTGTYFPSLNVKDACGNNLTLIDTIVIIVPPSVPGADFKADARVVTTSDSVRFTDLSTFGPSSWSYTFNPPNAVFVGGTAQNPIVRFNAPGTYEVTLTASNSVGDDVETKTAYIRVVNICTPDVHALVPDIGINSVKLEQLSNNSNSGTTGFTSYFSNPSVNAALLDAGGNYEIVVSRNSALNRMNRKIWIDYNGDGDFYDAGELIGHETATLNNTWNLSFQVPLGAMRGATRMRVGAAFSDSTNDACGTNFYGEIEEYRVVISDDNTPPVLTILGDNPAIVEIGSVYTDAGATAFDAVDGNVTGNIVAASGVNTSASGTYTVRYNVSDNSGNAAPEGIRTVIVTKDNTPPVLTLASPVVVTIPVFGTFSEPGYAASDAIAGNLTDSVKVDLSDLNLNHTGTYEIIYTVKDRENNTVTRKRTVHVIDITTPVITLNGNSTVEVEVFTPFADPGVLVSDDHDAVIFASVTSNVDINVLGTYSVRYTAIDSSGNITTTTRSVKVVDRTAPTLQVVGADTVVVDVFGQYALPVRIASDNYDQNVAVITGGTLNLNVIGDYTISFVAKDASGNQSAPVTRVVRVVDREAPFITLNGPHLLIVERWSTFNDPGATVKDNYDVGLTAVELSNFQNTATKGLYNITYNVTDLSGNKAAEVVRAVYIVDNTTGLNDVSGGMDVKLYPNPANSKVTLELVNGEFNNSSIEIVNLLGQTVQTITPGNLTNTHTLDVSALSAGVYHVKVVSEGKVAVVRLVISK